MKPKLVLLIVSVCVSLSGSAQLGPEQNQSFWSWLQQTAAGQVSPETWRRKEAHTTNANACSISGRLGSILQASAMKPGKR